MQPAGSSSAVPGYPDLRAAPQADVTHVSRGVLGGLEAVARALGRIVTIFSGYRSPSYSANVGGYSNDPHTRGVAADASIGGTAIGSYPGALPLIGRAGLESGDQPGFYRGGPDPSHVQIPGSGANKSIRDYGSGGGGGGGGGSAAGVPPELATAISGASSRYGVPQSTLIGVWRIESGSTFPNPYKNAQGYGGLFGTTHWNTSTSDQANYAAQTIKSLWRRYGSLSAALYHYSGGAYTSVDGSSGGSYTPGPADTGGAPPRPGAPGAATNTPSTPSGEGFGPNESDIAFHWGNVLHDRWPWESPTGPQGFFGQVAGDTAGGVRSIAATLAGVAWLFHPVNYLRAFEALTGVVMLLLGVWQLGKQEPGTDTGGSVVAGFSRPAGSLARTATRVTVAGRLARKLPVK